MTNNIYKKATAFIQKYSSSNENIVEVIEANYSGKRDTSRVEGELRTQMSNYLGEEKI